jgi:cytochrome c-type biogenesis protein CcmH/NrfG
VYQSTGDDPSAQAAATKATEVDPAELSHWRLLATISMRMGARERAVAAAQRVLVRQPDDAVARGIIEAARALPPRVPPRRP